MSNDYSNSSFDNSNSSYDYDDNSHSSLHSSSSIHSSSSSSSSFSLLEEQRRVRSPFIKRRRRSSVEIEEEEEEEESIQQKNKPNRHNRIQNMKCFSLNCLLYSAVIFWVTMQLNYFYLQQLTKGDSHNTPRNTRFQSRTGEASLPKHQQRLQEQRAKQASEALGTAAVPRKRRHRKKYLDDGRHPKWSDSIEAPPDGCNFTKWQETTLPNCMDVHSISLRPILSNYIGSGLWRDVWNLQSAVLKTMKMDHPYDPRNHDRHRRDALAMESLASNASIVDIYAFCGYSVITELLEYRLDHILFPSDDNADDDLHLIRKNSSAVVLPTRNTPKERLELALHVTNAVYALHASLPSPIVHADLQAKQFLISSSPSGYQLKLNDFNRCRFMALHNFTQEPCQFRIPSSPGRYRSPEEYLGGNMLTEKLDVYSLAHVYYGILTGRRPFENPDDPYQRVRLHEWKNNVMYGQKPLIEEGYRMTDEGLVKVVECAYKLKPEERCSAYELMVMLRGSLYAMGLEEGGERIV